MLGGYGLGFLAIPDSTIVTKAFALTWLAPDVDILRERGVSSNVAHNVIACERSSGGGDLQRYCKSK